MCIHTTNLSYLTQLQPPSSPILYLFKMPGVEVDVGSIKVGQGILRVDADGPLVVTHGVDTIVMNWLMTPRLVSSSAVGAMWMEELMSWKAAKVLLICRLTMALPSRAGLKSEHISNKALV